VKLVVVDYSETRDSCDRGIPALSLRSGKFVQLRKETTEYLVMAPREVASFHADIVERFCRERGISGSRDAEGKRYTISEQAWVIVGGGKFELDRCGKTIRFYDNSMAYGRFDSKGLKGKIHALGELSDYSVDIG
jgi:hypothetical protein